MKLNELQSILRPKLFLTEGQDDEGFLRAALAHLGINDAEIVNCEGNTNFTRHIASIVKVTGFSNNVLKFGVIRDAEDNFATAFQSLADALSKAKLAAPTKTIALSLGNPKVGIFTFPGNSKNGMLEDLCLASISTHPAMACVNSFYTCASRLPNPPQNPAKARAKGFLAAMPVSVPHVGVAATKGYWDFHSAAMGDLLTFLRLFV